MGGEKRGCKKRTEFIRVWAKKEERKKIDRSSSNV